jgi:hypothetical protein
MIIPSIMPILMIISRFSLVSNGVLLLRVGLGVWLYCGSEWENWMGFIKG